NPRHQSNSAPVRSYSGAPCPGSSSVKPNAGSSICAAVAWRSSSSVPSAAGTAASANTCASQPGPLSPPPASQPLRLPCSSEASTASPRARMESCTSAREGSDGLIVGTGAWGAASLAIRPPLALVARWPECLHSAPDTADAVQGNNVPIDPADPRLLGAAILLLVAVAVVVQRNRARQRLQRLLQREERLKMALWATGEHYWEYDVGSQALRLLLVEPDAEGLSDVMHERLVKVQELIHPDDIPVVERAIRDCLEGTTRSVVVE